MPAHAGAMMLTAAVAVRVRDFHGRYTNGGQWADPLPAISA